jgi:DNA polymerase III subunit epsilon
MHVNAVTSENLTFENELYAETGTESLSDLLSAKRLAIIDLETTGINAQRDRITEIAIISVSDGIVVDEWSSLINPLQSIPAEIQALTGISNAMVKSAPTFESVFELVHQRLNGALFVAHNARFDYGFIKNAYARCNKTLLADALCTVRLSRRLDPEQSSHSLDALVQKHRLASEQRHRAMGDARMAWQLIHACRLPRSGAR